MKSKRIFIAIKIKNTDEIKGFFRQVQDDFRYEKIKWVDQNGLHLTLAFLGDTDERKIAMIVNRMKALAKVYQTFALQIKGMGAFPSPSQARILWLGVKADSVLFQLQKEILKQLEYIATVADERFSPHVTIGRIKEGVQHADRVERSIENYRNWKDEIFHVEGFEVMESKLTSKGPIYSILERINFNG